MKYRHYKSGKIYEIVAEAKHSETLEELVIYKRVEDGSVCWARPKKMFFESLIIDGQQVLRFQPLK